MRLFKGPRTKSSMHNTNSKGLSITILYKILLDLVDLDLILDGKNKTFQKICMYFTLKVGLI